MRKLNNSSFLLRPITLLWLGVFIFATTKMNAQKTETRIPGGGLIHCGTMEEMERMIRIDPTLPEKWRLEGERRQRLNEQSRGNEPQRVDDGEIVIPVVFHIVGAAADVNAIPDRDAYEQIEILNRDYYGKKADLYAGLYPAGIASRVGRVTSIKFVLARRTPAGVLTSGIERRITTQTFTANTIGQIKHTSTGGLDAWNTDKYLNVWCCSFTDGLLGIATFPFTGTADEQGVCIGLYTLGGNTCRNYYPNYPDGATLSHEVGHYFYLWHTFGDQAPCNNADFRIQAGWPLPAPALIDDTPPEQTVDATRFGNPSGAYTDGCAPLPDGIAYGSYMNYYDDRALFMFTEGHKQRVIGTIDLYRAGLKTSVGGTPPSAVNDAYLVSMVPFGRCDSRLPIVANSPIVATIRNLGTTPLTAVNINVVVGANPVVSTTTALSLAVGADTTITVGTAPALAGIYTLSVYTRAPNGGTDAFVSNDTLNSLVTVRTATISAPFTETFTLAAFPPVNWSINNPQSATWTRSATAGFTTAGAATVQNYNYNGSGQLDELITPPIDYGAFDSSRLTFRVAYSSYSNNVYDWDGLEVLISQNGGRTYKMAYKKTGHDLRTVPGLTTGSFNPLVDQTKWRTESLNLTPYLVAGQSLIIKFRNTNAYGNNLYLDDVSVSAIALVRRDIYPTAFVNLPALVCPGTTVAPPSVTVANGGLDVITSLSLNYSVDNGTLVTIPITGTIPRGGNATFVLGTLNIGSLAPGVHSIRVYTSLPNGLADQFTSNDTIRANFTIFGKQADPLVEGFEGAVYPPTGWGIVNPDGAITWSKTTIASKTGAASAYMNNYNYAVNGQRDLLQSPVVVPTAGSDSMFLNFQLSASTYSYPGSTALPLDTLEVLLTTNCGATTQSVYKKWGTALQTILAPNSPNDPEFIPLTKNQWRLENVNLTPYLTSGANGFQVIFRNTSNFENNIFIDDINLFTKTLPAKLKAQGYMITPNPFTTSFVIQHYLRPVDLQGVGVYNSIGQLMKSISYNGTAQSYINVDMSAFASGMYSVQLRYTNRTVTERILKVK